MNPIINIAKNFSKKCRERRAVFFKSTFSLNENTMILDLGSGNGSHIQSVLLGTAVKPEKTFIADINPRFIEKGKNSFGYVPVLISEANRLPFDDQFFDIVYCSSVIEHVTIPKDQIWLLYSGEEFKKKALKRQKEFACEIQRIGKQYFVQAPCKHFPIESHSWLPFLSFFPRRMLIPILKFSNFFWVKKTSPDWHFLNQNEMLSLFDGASIVYEKMFGINKSIMAIKSLKKTGSSPISV